MATPRNSVHFLCATLREMLYKQCPKFLLTALMQGLQFFKEYFKFRRCNQLAISCFNCPGFGFQQRSAAVITELFSFFKKIAAIPLRNICRNGIRCPHELLTNCFLCQTILISNPVPNNRSNLHGKLKNLQIIQRNMIFHNKQILR